MRAIDAFEAKNALETLLNRVEAGEEIVITRNTSEGNNLVSSGLQLGPDDEILLFSDNHPSNLNAWRQYRAASA